VYSLLNFRNFCFFGYILWNHGSISIIVWAFRWVNPVDESGRFDPWQHLHYKRDLKTGEALLGNHGGLHLSKYTVDTRLRAERDAMAQTNAIDAFLRMMNYLCLSGDRSPNQRNRPSPILKGKVVDILTELGHV
jgi:hypothetical protein